MTKSEIYEYINKNKMKFLGSNIGTYDEKLDNWIRSQGFKIPVFGSQNVFDYLNDDKGKFCNCGKPNKFDTFSHGYSKFCSKDCLYKWRSVNMIGEKNNIYKATPETLKEMGKKNSIRIKKSIAEGKFTPCVTNSWAKSRCIVEITQGNIINKIKCRSSWDAYFQIRNPELLYERIRIPYVIKNELHNYIVDFVDIKNKIIYEIKPEGLCDLELNQIKFKAALDWCETNQYTFNIISNEWFETNYDESLLKGQPDEYKIKRLLKQFKNEN